MHPSSLHFFPLGEPFLLILVFLAAILLALMQVGVIGYVYEAMGVHRRYVASLLILSLLGSYVNIPVAELHSQEVVPAQIVTWAGIRWIIPEALNVERTVIAVNLGGALVPTLLSLYLLWRNALWLRGVAAVAAIATIVHFLARPVPGIGIAVPTLAPPLTAAVVAILLSRSRAAPLAYVSGSLGTLIGADLLNLHRLEGLGAPVASIGGAGTFDGIFLTGILAVVLASLVHPPGAGQKETPKQDAGEKET